MNHNIRELADAEVAVVAGGNGDDIPYCGTKWKPGPPIPWRFDFGFTPVAIFTPHG
jgi:hypothetical protein